MSDAPSDQNFLDYKKAERKALEIMREMKATSARKTDIELALIVAVFELHKGALPGSTVASIIQGHVATLKSYYAGA